MARKCKHTRAVDKRYWVPTKPGLLPPGVEMLVRCCLNCGDYVPLGDSDEASVAVEVRAAALAIERTGRSDVSLRGFADGAEVAGWICNAFDSEKIPEQDGEWAGWLAREIATHTETP